MHNYVAPKHRISLFSCPHCGGYSQQQWPDEVLVNIGDGKTIPLPNFDLSTCVACEQITIWQGTNTHTRSQRLLNEPVQYQVWSVIWPQYKTEVPSHRLLPNDLRSLYDEAREVAGISPRSAAALLRLLTEHLVKIKAPQKDLNNGIAQLFREKVLDSNLQQVADYLRLTGNSAVHDPGKIYLEEDPQQINTLFSFVNMLVQKLIAEPEEINELYAVLPEGKRNSIENRDSPAQSSN